MPPVEIRGLSKRFGKVESVRDLSFDVQSGRVTGSLGPMVQGRARRCARFSGSSIRLRPATR